jgi:hypothetical protein
VSTGQPENPAAARAGGVSCKAAFGGAVTQQAVLLRHRVYRLIRTDRTISWNVPS